MDTQKTEGGEARPQGTLQMQRTRDLGLLTSWSKDTNVEPVSKRWHLLNFLTNRRREVPGRVALAMLGRITGFVTLQAKLSGVVYRPDFTKLSPENRLKVKALLADNFDVRELPRYFGGQSTDYGVMSRRLVTDPGVGFIVDAFQNLVELELMKFHGYGTGTTAEAQADSALVTELTTEYVVNSTRPTGSQTETSSNIYRTVGTLSPDSGGTIAVTEHGIFSASSAGVLLDRSKFAAVNLVANADSLQTTYDLTLTAGG